MKRYSISSWNVNGLRAVLRKGEFQKFVETYDPDLICLQETKARKDQTELDLPNYVEIWNSADRPGYAGTAIFAKTTLLPNFIDAGDLANTPLARTDPRVRLGFSKNSNDVSNIQTSGAPTPSPLTGTSTDSTIPSPLADPYGDPAREGRVTTLELPEFYLVTVYAPNSKPDLSRLDLRETKWDPAFLTYLKELEKTKPVVTCGDFNAAHAEIDLARPDTNHHNAGFTDAERQGITNLLNAGFVDTFRALHPDEKRYTWWSHWGHARENNVGWRIDYFFVSKSLRKNLISADIYESQLGSDHCPVNIVLEF